MAECHFCGRRFPLLYRLTPEDIQREHLPPLAFQMACGECLDRLRLISNLVPEQSLEQLARNFAWMIPLFSLGLVATAIAYSLTRAEGLSEFGPSSQWLGIAAVLVGTLMVWDRTKRRYGFTHDLKWTLNSKKVNLAVAIVIAGVLVFVLSTALLR